MHVLESIGFCKKACNGALLCRAGEQHASFCADWLMSSLEMETSQTKQKSPSSVSTYALRPQRGMSQ